MHWIFRLWLVILAIFELEPLMYLTGYRTSFPGGLVIFAKGTVAEGTESRLFVTAFLALLVIVRLGAAATPGTINGQMRAVLILTHAVELPLFLPMFRQNIDAKLAELSSDEIAQAFLIITFVVLNPFIMFLATWLH